MKLMLWLVVMIAVAPLCPGGDSKLAGDSEEERKTLAGITSVSVTSEKVSPGVGRSDIGLTRLQTDVELKLRLAGMRVIESSGTTPLLHITVSLTGDGRAACIAVDLVQGVRLLRNPSIVTGVASTWSVGGIISNPNNKVIHNFVEYFVDEFLNAWLSVNPRR